MNPKDAALGRKRRNPDDSLTQMLPNVAKNNERIKYPNVTHSFF